VTKEEFLSVAADSFKKGRLQYLVGAGVSQAAGLPSWMDLNHRLLSRFLNRHHERLELQASDLREISKVFVERFGRDAAVDIVREQWPDKETSYSDILRDALYDRRRWEPKTIHYELASALGDSRFWTFNYDDLLQRGIRQLLGVKPLTQVRTKEPTDGRAHVVHLHGYLPLDPDHEYEDEKSLVLSEQDYHRTAGGWPTAELRKLLVERHDVDVLLVGLSLADPRLRSVLLERREKIAANERVPHVFALLAPTRCASDASLVTRLAHNFTRAHEQESWKFWHIDVLYPENHELVPFYLRQIRLGATASDWFTAGESFLREKSPRYETLLGRQGQLEMLSILRVLLDFFCARFAAQRDEHVSLGGYVPWHGRLVQAFRDRVMFGGSERPTSDDNILSEKIEDRLELRVDDLGHPEGATGYSFATGVVAEVLRDSGRLYSNFRDPAKQEQWEAKREFSSLLCVPVYGSRRWAPLGVMYLTSNQPTPFWARLTAEDQEQLQIGLRSCFRELMGYDDM
jgi:SIR2-like domain